LNHLDIDYKRLVNLKDNNICFTSKDILKQKKDFIDRCFYSLKDEYKQEFLMILRNNTLTNNFKKIINNDDLALLNKKNIIFKEDFISLSIILKVFKSLEFKNFIDKNIK
jgi:hypothetical protein